MPLVVLSAKVQPEVLEQWKKAQEESEAQTGNQFIELVLEAFLNPKVRTVEIVKATPEHETELQNLKNEIGRLKIDLDFKNETITELTEKAANVPPVTTAPILEENQVLLNLSPKVLEVAKIEAATAERRTKKPFSLEDVFKQNFWSAIMEGQAYPWRVWSSSEIAAIEKKIAQQ